MANIITRVFANEAAATKVKDRLWWEGFPKSAMRVVTGAGRNGAALQDMLEKANLPGEAASAYANRLAGSEAAALVVRATYKPLGAARIAREILDAADAIDMGGVSEDTYMPDGPDHAPSVLKDHPRLMTLPDMGDELVHGPITGGLGMQMLRPRKPSNSVMSGGRMMLGGNVKRGRVATSAMSGTRHMSRAFWPMPLLSDKPRRKKVMGGGGGPIFSRMLGMATISRR